MPGPRPTPFTLSAWIDESLIIGRDAADTYTLAAVVADQDDCDDLRATMLDLAVRPQVRLHWVAESAKRRDLIAQTISTLDIAAIVTVGAPMNRSKQERARRCCLEHPLHELAKFGVSDVWLESRRVAQDRRDLRLVDSARLKRLIGSELVVGFARPDVEPMLWLPDAVAGQVNASILGGVPVADHAVRADHATPDRRPLSGSGKRESWGPSFRREPSFTSHQGALGS